MSQPVSRVLSWTIIHLGRMSPYISSSLPGSDAGHIIGSLFSFAPGGVYPATLVTKRAVRSYHTISPLPNVSIRRYIFCGTGREFTLPRRYLAPYPMEPGLSSIKTAIVWLTQAEYIPIVPEVANFIHGR